MSDKDKDFYERLIVFSAMAIFLLVTGLYIDSCWAYVFSFVFGFPLMLVAFAIWYIIITDSLEL